MDDRDKLTTCKRGNSRLLDTAFEIKPIKERAKDHFFQHLKRTLVLEKYFETCPLSPMLLPMPLLLLHPSLGTKKPTTKSYVATTKPKIGQAKWTTSFKPLKLWQDSKKKQKNWLGWPTSSTTPWQMQKQAHYSLEKDIVQTLPYNSMKWLKHLGSSYMMPYLNDSIVSNATWSMNLQHARAKVT